jgi:hypothetical protein
MLVGARFLPPDLKGLGQGALVIDGRHQMPTRTEMAIDHAVRREEPLGLPGQLEPLHLPLPSPRSLARVLCAVIQVADAPMQDLG